jgi:hypothetical protein
LILERDSFKHPRQLSVLSWQTHDSDARKIITCATFVVEVRNLLVPSERRPLKGNEYPQISGQRVTDSLHVLEKHFTHA